MSQQPVSSNPPGEIFRKFDDSEMIELIIQNLQEAVVLFNNVGQIHHANKPFYEIFGYPEETIMEEKFSSLFSRIDLYDTENNILSHDQLPFQEVLQNKSFSDLIIKIHNKKTGKISYGKFRGIPMDYNGDVVVKGMVCVQDITGEYQKKTKYSELISQLRKNIIELVYSKEHLENERKLLEAIINIMPVMVTIYDPSIETITMNEAVEEITGWTNEDAAKTNIMELAYPDPVYRETVSHFMQTLQEGFRDFVMRTKDGRDVETSWANVRIPDGRHVGVGIDISARVNAEKELKKSEERFRNMADNISQFAWITDSNGNIKWYNKRWHDYTGTTLEEVQDWGWTRCHHPDHIERVKKSYQDAVSQGKSWEEIFPLRGKDGNYRWYLTRALPIRDEDGNIIRWFGTSTDITDRKKMEEELRTAKEKAEKAMSTQMAFMQNISHEIRTPMNSILGFSELLKKTITNTKEKKYLDAINHNGQQLLRLIDDIVDLSRLDKNELPLSKKKVYLKHFIEHTIHQFEGLKYNYKKKNLSFTLIKPPGEKEIVLQADVHRLQQVISNLLSNAVKYTDEGTIELGFQLKEEQKMVQIHVKDTGTGIKKEAQYLVFKRFQQLNATRKNMYGGTGLGLAICKHLVNLFGGKIWFESEPGKGSAFYFTHPYKDLVDNVEIMEENGDEINDSVPDLKGKTILIAEDDDFSYLMMESMLQDTKADIIHAPDGSKAVEMFNKNNVDLVFLDIRLPGLDGYQVLEEIKRINTKVPVIAQTANAMVQERLKSINAGFDYHATKPISMSKLYSLLNTYLADS